MRFICLIVLLFTGTVSSQHIFIQKKDDLKQIVPAKYVKLKIDDNFYYTNGDGHAYLNEHVKISDCSKIIIVDFNLKVQSCEVKGNTLEVLVVDKLHELQAVTLSKTARKIKITKRRTGNGIKSLSNYFLKPGQEIVTKIEFDINELLLPKNITLFFDQHKGINQKTDELKAVVRLQFYQNDDDGLIPVYQSENIYVTFDKSMEVEYQFDEHVPFVTGTFYIGLEYVGAVTNDGNFADSDLSLRPQLSNRPSKNIELSSFLNLNSSPKLSNLISSQSIQEKYRGKSKYERSALNFEMNFN